MANSTQSQLEVTHYLPLSEHADLARSLIAANDLYRISNSTEYTTIEREQALTESGEITKKVLAELPNDVSALNLSARIELDKGQIKHAKELLRKAIGIEPENLNSLMNLGYAEIAAENYDRAESLFKTVLSKDTSNAKAFSAIALIKLKTNDYLAAFAHYRKLVEHGVVTAQIKASLIDSMEFLSVDYYQEDLEYLVVNAFSWGSQDYQKLANISSSLIKQKYALNDPNSALDMNTLISDQLLLEAIKHCLMPSLEVEELITAIRQSILSEVSITQGIRDELLPMIIAISHYSARNDYVLMMSQDEESEVARLIHEIKALVASDWATEDAAGALLVLAMYEALYTQPFSYRLLGKDLEDWPLGMQDVMHDALYELSLEHQYQYQLYNNTSESILSNEVRRSSDRWKTIPQFTQSSIYKALSMALPENSVPKRFKRDELNVLVLGCGSGRRAAYLASAFKNINVVAIDEDPVNIAYARMMADHNKISNLVFLHSNLETVIGTETTFDIIEVGEAINFSKSPGFILETWKGLLANDGLLRLTLSTLQAQESLGVVSQLVKARNLSATTDNIRHLRNAIAKEAPTGLWTQLFKDEKFYAGAGCKDLFFKAHQHFFDLQQVNKLLNRSALEFIDFVDIPASTKEKMNPLAPYSLLAWHVMDQDNSLFENAYQLYCRKA